VVVVTKRKGPIYQGWYCFYRW